MDGMGYLQTGPFLDHLTVIIKEPIMKQSVFELQKIARKEKGEELQFNAAQKNGQKSLC